MRPAEKGPMLWFLACRVLEPAALGGQRSRVLRPLCSASDMRRAAKTGIGTLRDAPSLLKVAFDFQSRVAVRLIGAKLETMPAVVVKPRQRPHDTRMVNTTPLSSRPQTTPQYTRAQEAI